MFDHALHDWQKTRGSFGSTEKASNTVKQAEVALPDRCFGVDVSSSFQNLINDVNMAIAACKMERCPAFLFEQYARVRSSSFYGVLLTLTVALTSAPALSKTVTTEAQPAWLATWSGAIPFYQEREPSRAMIAGGDLTASLLLTSAPTCKSELTASGLLFLQAA